KAVRTPRATFEVNLSGAPETRPAGMSADEAGLAIQQLVYSLNAVVGATNLPVQFSVDGKPVTKLLGQDVGLKVLPDEEALATVQITNLTDGQIVKAGSLTVKGVAATFEANVVWELLLGGDAVVDQGHTTAAECCKLAPYSFTIENLEPGTYTLVVHDSDESGEGRPVNQ